MQNLKNLTWTVCDKANDKFFVKSGNINISLEYVQKF